MKKILGVALVLVFAATASANATALLDFDQTGPASGTVSWDGGVLTGSDITFEELVVTGSNMDGTYMCTDGTGTGTAASCLLSFTSGSLASNDGFTLTFASGGTLVLNGFLEDGSGNIVGGDPIIFDGVFNLSNFAIFNNTGFGGGTGDDVKDPDLLAFLGLGLGAAQFVETTISTGQCTGSIAEGSFTCNVTEADLQNLVPEPGTFGLFGLGLLALGYTVRRRQRLAA